MRHHLFGAGPTYQIAVLSKNTAFNRDMLDKNYIRPLRNQGVSDDIVAFTAEYEENGKASAKFVKAYLDELMPELKELGVTHIYVADGTYFKALAGVPKSEPHQGYVLPCKVKGYEHMHVVLGLNYQQLVYKPDLQEKLDQALSALASHWGGSYQPPGAGIIHAAVYPEGLQAVQEALEQLLGYPALTCDFEAFSLRFNEAGLATVAFAVDQHRGVAFPIDYKPNADTLTIPFAEKREEYGRFVIDYQRRAALRWFFENYQGKLIFHNANFDIKLAVYALWMKDALDTEGLLRGIEVMTRHFDDTKIIAYLATNSCAGNVLGLKALAHEFAGNWAVEDIKDVRRIPLPQLLQYNLVDCLSTWYVHSKFYPIMVADNQEPLYQGLMKKSVKLILQIELTGMPMGEERILEVERELLTIQAAALKAILAHPMVAKFEDWKTYQLWEKDFEDRKAKAKNPGKILPKDRATFPRHEFNPDSGPQLQILLHEMLKLPVLDLTDTGQPATGAETLEKLRNHAPDQPTKDFLEGLIQFGQVGTLLSNFIPSFKRAIKKAPDGIVWLHGNFNIGGTVSGRLSSSDPNLQNIPANVEMVFNGIKIHLGKLVKTIFFAPPGWIFAGADFNSLEDYISALTTKDPNKLAVYERGFDGHCLRAAYYFREQLLHVDLDDPTSVNQLAKTHKHLRQDSKAPTFALTYQGTWRTLQTNLGWPEQKCRDIEKNYHTLYKASDDYVQARLKQASIDGYVEVAFGLRLRTPMIKSVVWGGARMPSQAAAEGRTAGNAMGQSYGLLNNRAAVEFMEKVWASPYRYDIKPVALIHDAVYILIREDVAVVEFANRELIKSMQWQQLPEIQHPTVKLGAALDLYWPNWANPITLPNGADQATIIQMCADARAANDETKKERKAT